MVPSEQMRMKCEKWSKIKEKCRQPEFIQSNAEVLSHGDSALLFIWVDLPLLFTELAVSSVIASTAV